VPLLPNSKSIYTDWHKTFPGSGQGKQYPYLLDKILTHNREQRRHTRGVSKPWHTILDYGCGKGGTALWLHTLIKKQPLEIDLYDPGHDAYKHTPLRDSYDLVYSCDVLEHIEPEDIHGVIEHTQRLAKHNIHIIDMTQAKKRLPDGRNAHVLLQDKYEWIETFEQHAHTIEEVFAYSIPDPNFTTRDRVCIWTRALKDYTKR
jgi:2-polyprenyl-3-methyl-5-hydroxy-6-metoxy-1,4-benzoquinol methylase